MMVKGRIIYIIGFMGSGKTTAGKKLASALNWTFIDLDRKIEERTGRTIPEIFSLNGEGYFRETESFLLRDLKSVTNTIISTGGGTPCFNDNMDFMIDNGLTIYLKLSPEQLQNRLSESSGQRPLIKGLGKKELLSFIEEKLEERERWYKQSGLIIEVKDLDINTLLPPIKAWFNI